MFVTNESLGIQEISCADLKDHQSDFVLIDVRTPEEYTGELGHIKGAQLVTLGPELEDKINTLSDDGTSYVFVCRSGGRSGQATAFAKSVGLSKVYNMIGGMLEWNRQGFEVE